MNKLEATFDQVERLEAGDDTEWSNMYQSMKGSIVGILRSKSCQPELAEDIAHNTLTKLLSQKLVITNESALKCWLFKVSLNDFYDHTRKDLAHPFSELHEDIWKGTPVARHNLPTIEQVESRIDLTNSFDTLTQPQQEVIGLWSIDFNYIDISGMLGEKYDVIRARVNRGIVSLRPKITSSLDTNVLTR